MRIPMGIKGVTQDGFEICVLCSEKAEPSVLFSTPIDQRTGYVEMCGQTCANIKLCQERQERNKRRKNGSQRR